MGDTFTPAKNSYVVSGLRELRSSMAGRLVDLRRELDKLQADLVHVDAVLRQYGLEPSEIPTKGRMPVRSAYFGRNEISRRCRDLLRERGSIRADEVTVQAMRDKGLDHENRKLRADLNAAHSRKPSRSDQRRTRPESRARARCALGIA